MVIVLLFIEINGLKAAGVRATSARQIFK